MDALRSDRQYQSVALDELAEISAGVSAWLICFNGQDYTVFKSYELTIRRLRPTVRT
jgi:hypothetical protein